ncbi:hypothetical protein TIFTF001_007026 [Ficus carica]|uniref:Uncharacterized protein n=1 Tax=Ficus carica TaxID=3494 RepID=A0AA88A1Z0_FICCA|nr:hypothetical protein TIFTF001_007026 [Ficus carica]
MGTPVGCLSRAFSVGSGIRVTQSGRPLSVLDGTPPSVMCVIPRARGWLPRPTTSSLDTAYPGYMANPAGEVRSGRVTQFPGKDLLVGSTRVISIRFEQKNTILPSPHDRIVLGNRI